MGNAIYNLSLNVKHPTVLNIERQSRYNFSLPHHKPLIINGIGFRHVLQSYIGPCHQLKLGEGLFVCCSLALGALSNYVLSKVAHWLTIYFVIFIIPFDVTLSLLVEYGRSE